MGIRDVLGFESARTHHRAAEVPPPSTALAIPTGQLPNSNGPDGTVAPGSSPGDPEQMMSGEPWPWLGATRWDGWPEDWATPPMEPIGGDWSGYGFGRQNPSGYLGRVSTVMTCTDLTSKQLASFPIYGHADYRPFTLPDWSSSPQPELYDSWPTFMKTLVNSMILRGESVLWATDRYATGFPARFVVLNVDWLSIEPDGEGSFDYKLGKTLLDRRDVLHIKYQSLASRARGLGPLEWAAANIADADVLRAYASNIARYGVSAVLKHPQNLTGKQSADLKGAFMASRASGRGTPAVLSGGITYEAISMSPTDMALVDLLHMNEQRIAAAIGTPPVLAGLPQPGGSLTYSSVNMLTDFWWRSALRPLAAQISASMSNWLLPRGKVVEFNRDEFVRPDAVSVAQYYATLHSIVDPVTGEPAISVPEIRRAERFDARAGDSALPIGVARV